MNKNILNIESDGTSYGTKISVNGKEMEFVSKLTLQVKTEGLVQVRLDSFFNDINLQLVIPEEIKEALLKIQNFTASQNYFGNKVNDET